jgi:hypothetical protein
VSHGTPCEIAHSAISIDLGRSQVVSAAMLDVAEAATLETSDCQALLLNSARDRCPGGQRSDLERSLGGCPIAESSQLDAAIDRPPTDKDRQRCILR